MVSCWLIRFEDGYKMIISEEFYNKEVERNWAGRPRMCEEHWFDVRKCVAKNRSVNRFGDLKLYLIPDEQYI